MHPNTPRWVHENEYCMPGNGGSLTQYTPISLYYDYTLNKFPRINIFYLSLFLSIYSLSSISNLILFTAFYFYLYKNKFFAIILNFFNLLYFSFFVIIIILSVSHTSDSFLFFTAKADIRMLIVTLCYTRVWCLCLYLLSFFILKYSLLYSAIFILFFLLRFSCTFCICDSDFSDLLILFSSFFGILCVFCFSVWSFLLLY